MVEFDAFLLSEFLYEVIVELLLVSGILQGVPDQIHLMHIQLDIIPAADHRQDGDRFVRVCLRSRLPV